MNPEPKVGQHVCAVGRGTDRISHSHEMVVRVTKTMIVTEHIVRSDTKVISRYRRDDGASIPRSDYGGTVISTKCQRPRKKEQ